MDLAELGFKVDSRQLKKGKAELSDFGKQGAKTSKDLDKSAKSVNKSFTGMATAIKYAATAYGAFKAIGFLKDATMLAARYETLGVVMKVAGNNAGYSAKQMAEFEKGLQKAGIAMIESRSTLTKMAQAQIDLTQSATLARIAQDAAVIGNINSSEAFDRMIHGIQAGMPLILRNIGIQVDFEAAYQKSAKALNKTSTELTTIEKTQARANAVIEEGAKIQGIYEQSMTTAGKQMLSLKRHTDNLKVGLGAAFTPALAEIVEQITQGIMGINDELGKTDAIEDWGSKFRLQIIEIEANILRAYMGIVKWRIGLRELIPFKSEKTKADISELNKIYGKLDNTILNLAIKYNKLEQAMSVEGKAATEKARKEAEDKVLALRALAKKDEEQQAALAKIKELQDEALKDWNKYRTEIERNIKVSALDDLGKTLAENKFEAEDLIARFKDLPPTVRSIAYELIEKNKIQKDGIALLEDEKKKAKELKELAKEKSEVARDIYKDMSGYEQEYMNEYKKMIQEQSDYYRMLKQGDADWTIAVKKWETEQIRKAEEDQLMRSGKGTFGQGWDMGMRDWIKDALNMQKHGKKIAEDTANSMSSSFSEMFFDVAKGEFEGFGDYLKSFADSVLKSFTDMLGKMVTAWIMETAQMSLGGGTTGGGGGWLSSLGGMVSSFFAHEGGIVGQSAIPTRAVPAYAFAGAPRLHNGFMPDEYPAILQKGETVLPKGQGAITVNVPITGISDKQMVADLQNGIEQTVVQILRKHS